MTETLMSETSESKTGRAADAVVRQLSAKIQSGEYSDGAPLPPERLLMEEFGISRTVVREAVQSLSKQGLLEARPRHRPIVRKPGYDAALSAMESVVSHLLNDSGGVKNLFDTRILVEVALVRLAAQKAGREDIAALKSALDANHAAIEDSEEFYRTDRAFHALLYDIPRNPVLPALHKAYVTWLAPQWSQMPRLPARNRDNYDAHLKIFNGILMRDPDSAEEALRAHLEYAWEQVCETFGSDI
ncbi:FadR/GntR family transcriptional regulator [Tritonibacter horizontis]|uniref:HTH-type transcriptional regulator LutR n=1 Tax=Tritonibacter horizontis TaxID=1768241 RepID=A0A132C1W6_9RHOB|nr:FCD domain-containing protein [Tritonibacter horizontis]KUP94559.1 HTH-type transcriptional regulator LutR [Tritonibacter horizontis]